VTYLTANSDKGAGRGRRVEFLGRGGKQQVRAASEWRLTVGKGSSTSGEAVP
jgi:hypothetical protein